MQTQQYHFRNGDWSVIKSGNHFESEKAGLVLLFGSRELLSDPSLFEKARADYPNAEIISCSTAGEIINEEVYDDTVTLTAIQFDNTRIDCIKTTIGEQENSFETGRFLFDALNQDDLNAIFILSDGTKINGDELVDGFNINNSRNIPITGGLAGDAARFQKTLVGLNEQAAAGNIVAVGFYGNHIQIGHSSLGGWDEFGKERIITRSDKNVLYEVDGDNALDLYKNYLGPYAEELPGSALLFPLSLHLEPAGQNLVRTILGVNDADKTMTFAGNLPEGSRVRFMKANFEKLVTASSIAAEKSRAQHDKAPELAILISCIGRKLVLQERSEDEVQAAKSIFGPDTCLTGFYSYGEISPLAPLSNCELHNQTMTITTFSEREC